MTFAGCEGFSEVDGGERARHRIADECALKRNVSAKLTSGVPAIYSEVAGDSVAVMPCNVLSYEPVIIWTVIASAVLCERSLVDVELMVGFFKMSLTGWPVFSLLLLFLFPIVYIRAVLLFKIKIVFVLK